MSYRGHVFGNLAGQGLGEDAGLKFQRPTVADLVVKQRMGQQSGHALLVGEEELLPPGRRQVHRLARRTKSSGVTMRLLMAVSTALSAINGRNSSIRSSASAGRPNRG